MLLGLFCFTASWASAEDTAGPILKSGKYMGAAYRSNGGELNVGVVTIEVEGSMVAIKVDGETTSKGIILEGVLVLKDVRTQRFMLASIGSKGDVVSGGVAVLVKGKGIEPVGKVLFRKLDPSAP